jgi:hypothetical protein
MVGSAATADATVRPASPGGSLGSCRSGLGRRRSWPKEDVRLWQVNRARRLAAMEHVPVDGDVWAISAPWLSTSTAPWRGRWS